MISKPEVSTGRKVAISDNSRFFGHLPRTLIDLNSSMSALPCWQQLTVRAAEIAAALAAVFFARASACRFRP